MFDRAGSRKYLTESERRAFHDAVLKERDEVMRSFGLTLFNTGCRISEALNTPIGCVDWSSQSIVFETLKQRKRGCYRAIPLPETLMASLRQITEGRLDSAQVWTFSRPTGYRFIKGIMSLAEVRGKMASPKGLRHGFAIACLARGVPLTTVKKWLGHARLETTAIYLDVSGSEERNLAKRLWQHS